MYPQSKHFPFPAPGEYHLRPFGTALADLDVDFLQPSRPLLVTGILRCCTETGAGEPVAEGFLQGLTVGKRIVALAVLATSGGAAGLTMQFHCSLQTCGELMEVSVSLDELRGLQPGGDDGETFPVPVDGGEYYFRRPTARDQMEWLNQPFRDEADAVKTMLQTLAVQHPGDAFPVEIIDDIDKGMKNADPLVHFRMTLQCPQCHNVGTFTLDLEEFLLKRLYRVQQDLLHTIHRIASRYHWSEEQIIALSPGRRRRYIELIGKEDAR